MWDFPPLYATAWWDDLYWLWSNTTIGQKTYCLRWIEPKSLDGTDRWFWMLPSSLDLAQAHLLIEKITQSVNTALVYEIKPYNIGDDPSMIQ